LLRRRREDGAEAVPVSNGRAALRAADDVRDRWPAVRGDSVGRDADVVRAAEKTDDVNMCSWFDRLTTSGSRGAPRAVRPAHDERLAASTQAEGACVCAR